MSNKIFFSIFSGFIVGVFVSSFVTINLSLSFLIGVIGVAMLMLAAFGLIPKKLFLSVALALVLCSLGTARFYLKDSQQQKYVLDNFVGRETEITGVIMGEVEHRQATQRIILEAEYITLMGRDYETRAKVLVSTELYPEFSYGDRIVVSGTLERPKNFTTDVGKEFDYINYLKKDGIFYTVSFADVELVGTGYGRPLKSAILGLKTRFLDKIERVIPKPESSLLSGLLLGVKESLGKDLEQDFVDTGLVHIIVLSGYNVTIIAEAVIKTLSFLSVMAGIYVGGAFIVVFAVMTGAGATIIRASIMALLALIARATGRHYEITRALLLAAMIMVIHNPYILVFDISFQLSFLATLGLIYMAPIMERIFRFLPNVLAIREITGATLGVQIFVLPFILWKIGNLSIVAPLTNLLVLPLVPATMFYGFVAGMLGFITHLIAAPFGFIAFALLKYEIFVVELFARLPFASVTVAKFPLVLVIISYILLIWWIKSYHARTKEKIA